MSGGDGVVKRRSCGAALARLAGEAQVQPQSKAIRKEFQQFHFEVFYLWKIWLIRKHWRNRTTESGQSQFAMTIWWSKALWGNDVCHAFHTDKCSLLKIFTYILDDVKFLFCHNQDFRFRVQVWAFRNNVVSVYFWQMGKLSSWSSTISVRFRVLLFQNSISWRLSKLCTTRRIPYYCWRQNKIQSEPLRGWQGCLLSFLLKPYLALLACKSIVSSCNSCNSDLLLWRRAGLFEHSRNMARREWWTVEQRPELPISDGIDPGNSNVLLFLLNLELTSKPVQSLMDDMPYHNEPGFEKEAWEQSRGRGAATAAQLAEVWGFEKSSLIGICLNWIGAGHEQIQP